MNGKIIICCKAIVGVTWPFVLLLQVSCGTEDLSENGFRIQVILDGIEDSTLVYIQNRRTHTILDSTYALDGQFVLEGKLDQPTEELRINNGSQGRSPGNFFYTDLLIGNEEVYLKADLEELPNNVETEGSPSQEIKEAFYKGIYRWEQQVKRLKSYISGTENTTLIADLKEEIEQVQDSVLNWQKAYLKSNFNSYFGLLYYQRNPDWIPKDSVSFYFEKVSPKLKDSYPGQIITKQIQESKEN